MNDQNAGSLRKTQGDQSCQLSLALEYAPPTIREHGYRAAHSYPLVGIRREGGRFDSWRTDPPRAWPYPYIQLDAAHVFSTLKLDIDNPEATAAAEDRGAMPPYNVQTINPRTRHKHVCYMLATPVARHPEARPAPLKLLSRIAEYFTTVAEADTGYNGVLTWNPTAPPPGHIVQWGRLQPYDLGELADYIETGFRVPWVARSAVARGSGLFFTGMKWAGRRANEGCSVLAMLSSVNACRGAEELVPDSELASIARSIERYRHGWAANGWHTPAWLAKQARLAPRGGKASGRVRRARAEYRAERARALREKGHTQREIAEALGVHRTTVYRMLHEPNTGNVPGGAGERCSRSV